MGLGEALESVGVDDHDFGIAGCAPRGTLLDTGAWFQNAVVREGVREAHDVVAEAVLDVQDDTAGVIDGSRW
ncbi:hypothetical protein AB0I54_03805 [Streptomyces sp. NPDC050625]|uniref:hypothetical protein n=1 Tax=Streptomyces sp. NPDC050625 TaxID=3154629 RepID=UPI00342DE6B3